MPSPEEMEFWKKVGEKIIYYFTYLRTKLIDWLTGITPLNQNQTEIATAIVNLVLIFVGLMFLKNIASGGKKIVLIVLIILLCLFFSSIWIGPS